MKITRTSLLLAAILLLAGTTFFTGINWGLPSRESDPLLFGTKKPWTGSQIMDLAGAWDDSPSRGADIAMHPLPGNRTAGIPLNETDARRAEIVRRFRLYSSQPDEMITFRSLSRMKPTKLKLDPGLYQYGGLWIYPVGILLKLGSFTSLITLRTDLAYYLDHPESFGRFYLLARGYSAAWGLFGVWVVFAIGREWTGKASTGITAAGIFVCLPIVIDLAHEAKPHLAGTVLILLTVYFAHKFVSTGRKKWWMLSGATAGAAMGMVLTGFAAFAVLTVMTLPRPMPIRNRLRITTGAGLIGLLVFAVTNPFLPANLLFHRSVLNSNVGNYSTFYQPKLTLNGIIFAGQSLLEGLSIVPTVLGGLGALYFLQRRISTGKWGSSIPILLTAPVAVALLQFVLLADGKTAEYARFALLADVAIAITAAALVDQLQFNPREKAMMSAVLIASTLYFGVRYDINFVADTQSKSTRRITARTLNAQKIDSPTLEMWAEPAPYSLPPVDLFNWHLVLMPRDAPPAGTNTLCIRPVDQPQPAPIGFEIVPPLIDPARATSPISWANKPFQILKSSTDHK